MRRLVVWVVAAAAFTGFSGLALASGPLPEAEAAETEGGEVDVKIWICIDLPLIDLPDLPVLLDCPDPPNEPPHEPPSPSPPVETPSPDPTPPSPTDPEPSTSDSASPAPVAPSPDDPVPSAAEPSPAAPPAEDPPSEAPTSAAPSASPPPDPGPLPEGLALEEADAVPRAEDEDSATLQKRMIAAVFAFVVAIGAGAALSGRAGR